MDNILDHVVVQGQRYDIVSPTAFGDYIETIGSACINPDGYAKGSTFLARLGNEQFYYEATAAITQGSAISEGTNCKKTTVAEYVDSVNEALTNEVEARAKLGAHNKFNPYTLVKGNESGGSTLVRVSTRDSREIFLKSGEGIVATVTNDATITFELIYYDTSYQRIDYIPWPASTTFIAQQDCYVVFNFRHNDNSNLTVEQVQAAKMLVKDVKDAYTGYLPYVPTNSQLLSYKDNGVLGAKNFLNVTVASETRNGITFTVSDGTVTISTGSGGATADTYFRLCPNSTLPSGKYILSGSPTDATNQTFALYEEFSSSTKVDEGNGIEFDATNEGYAAILVRNGTVITNPKTFKPMIRLASDTDTTYQPYAKTNRELTEHIRKIGRTAITGNSAKYTIHNQVPFFESYYLIKDGWVLVSLCVDCVTPSATSEAFSSLPLPDDFTTLHNYMFAEDTQDHILLILRNGTLYARGGTAGKRYLATFSYPYKQ